MKARPYNYWFFRSKLQVEKGDPSCDKCMLFYKTMSDSPIAIDRTFTVTVPYSTIHDLCKEYVKLTDFEQFAYECFGKWPVLTFKDENGNWYRMRSLNDVINSGELDVTGEFVEIQFDAPLMIYKRPCHSVTRFCLTTKDEQGRLCYSPGFSPDEIRARFVNTYPTCEP